MPSSDKRSSSEADLSDIEDDSVSPLKRPRHGHSRADTRASSENDAPSTNGTQHNFTPEDDEEIEDFEADGNLLQEADPDVEEEDLFEDPDSLVVEENTQLFRVGSIVGIRVKNFVTYANVELRPGPSLNMIIGPNGTGKSTLVCAICLGLGWQPNQLSRGTDLGDFVKHGEKDTEIEIELKGRDGELNPIIKRKITKDNNGSTFWINGKQSSNKKVLALAKDFNIQIDNLCQFLPQERVEDFAKMSPVEKLRQTERAAARPWVLQRHDDLAKLASKVQVIDSSLSGDEEQLKQLEQRQAGLQQDIDRINERAELQKRADLLEKAKPFLQYRLARKEYSFLKDRVRKGESELRRLQEQQAPFMERPANKKIYLDGIEKVLRKQKDALENKESEVKKQKTLIDRFVKSGKDAKANRKREHDAESKRAGEIDTLKKKIQRAKQELENEEPVYDYKAINAEMQSIKDEKRKVEAEANEAKASLNPHKEQVAQKRQRVSEIQKRIEALQSVAGRREENLRRLSKDAFVAWEWIQKNQDKFEMEILAPPAICCSVKDGRYADIVEAVCKGDMCTFTAQTPRDYRTLLDHLNKGLKLADFTIREFSRSGPLRDPAVNRDEIQRYGFDGYVADYIEGPGKVIEMLCRERSINSMPLSLKRLNEQKIKDIEQDQHINAFATGSLYYAIARRYGSHSTRVSDLAKASTFKADIVDHQQISNYQKEKNEVEDEAKQTMEYIKSVQATFKDYQQRVVAFDNELAEKRATKEEWQRNVAKFNKVKASLPTYEEQLREKKQGSVGFNDRVNAFIAQYKVALEKRAEASIAMANLVCEIAALHQDTMKLRLRRIEAASDLALFREKTESITRVVDRLAKEIDQEKQKMNRKKARASALQMEAQELRSQLTKEDADTLNDFDPEKTEEEIEDEIESLKNRLSLMVERNPAAKRQFDDRSNRIKILRGKIDKNKADRESHMTNIRLGRDEWEPILDRTVAKISSAFSRSFQKMGCNGEVQINKSNPDFGQWELEILVKFRDGEKLQVLDNHRQSGGERAVSTIYYLMALQRMAESPFRVVDEINQGMDPRNERMVHHRMVNTACQKEGSQYFLITPKLLGDLTYHPRMAVHCIYSGDWVEEKEASEQVNMSTYLKKAADLKAKRVAAVA